VNRLRLASDPDTTFHFDGDPGPDAIASFLLFTGLQFLVGEKGSYLSKMGQYIEIYWKKYSLALHIWLKWIWIPNLPMPIRLDSYP
jgi:hypothetical protein